MAFEKGELPPYSAAAPMDAPPRWRRGRPLHRPSRVLKVLGLACLGFIGYAQWRQISDVPVAGAPAAGLSLTKLEADNIDELTEASKTIDYKDSLDVIMEALE